jgi:hypothetical protein
MSHVHHPFTFFGLLVSGVSLAAAPAAAATVRHLRTPGESLEFLNRYRAEMAERAQAQRHELPAVSPHAPREKPARA